MTTKTTITDPSGPAGAGPGLPGGLAEVARAFLPHEAQMAVALLQASGIAATAFDPNTHIMLPHHAVALGGLRVMVPADDLNRAAVLLAQVPQVVTHRRPVMVLALIVLTWWCGAAPIPAGLYVRQPASGQAAGSLRRDQPPLMTASGIS